MQSFNYADITWEHKHDRPILDIKLRESPKGGMSIVTRQVSTPLTICSAGVAPVKNKKLSWFKSHKFNRVSQTVPIGNSQLSQEATIYYLVMNRFNSYSEEMKAMQNLGVFCVDRIYYTLLQA